jgi:hypothetical protein
MRYQQLAATFRHLRIEAIKLGLQQYESRS